MTSTPTDPLTDTTSSMTSSPPGATLSLSSAAAARLVNEYSPVYAEPYKRIDHYASAYLDPQLTAALLDDHHANMRNHLCCDRRMKEYLLEAKKFEAIEKRV